ncbi:CobW family GTP-binding protein [Psychromonas sp. PT13]|uniref:CobW family GTP-binding protein n=1 Tax=Psychromonas sp. PT13 TaxID=3439547 RepID=UPI003EBA39FE
MKHEKILAVPTNVITGFLGVGKTSVIMQLLSQKPKHERWAVLVNEFGEIGVDGGLLSGTSPLDSHVFIREVPGGCMCCASALPMQIALNQLLTEAKPHRLLIEPTGLGHPQEVLQLLSNEYYQETLHLEKTVTLVDARNLSDSRYTEHDTFNQQLEIADIIVGNKADLYNEQDKQSLATYLNTKGYTPEHLYFVEHGAVGLDWLSEKKEALSKRNNTTKVPHQHTHEHEHHHDHAHHHDSQSNIDQTPLESGFIKAINQGEGYQSIGWRFAANQLFNHDKLIPFLTHIKAIRVKAIFMTNDGIFGYNNTPEDFNEFTLNKADESRIEIICDTLDDTWEAQLKQLIIHVD